jgi:hypothetical protein
MGMIWPRLASTSDYTLESIEPTPDLRRPNGIQDRSEIKNPLTEWREASALFDLLVHVRQRSWRRIFQIPGLLCHVHAHASDGIARMEGGD